MALMQGKKGLIMGVANKMSIAYGIAKVLSENGAQLAFSFQGDILKKRVEPLAEGLGSNFLIECDVTKDSDIDNLFEKIEEKWGKLDFVVHAIAFSNKEELKGKYADTSRENFALTMDISCFSLTAVVKRAQKLMQDGGSIVTLTYYGAEKVIPNYNVMGVAKAALEASVRYLAADLGEKQIRINSISAGPIKTLAASAIGDFRSFQHISAGASPLKRNATPEDIGKTALYLLSDLSSAVTGEVLYVDSGYNIMGMCHNSAGSSDDAEST